MRLLFLNHNLAWRGTFFRAYHLARELARLGHEVDLWTVSRRFQPLGDRCERDGVRIWETPRWGRVGRHDGGYAPVDILARLARVPFGAWDVIHAFDHRPNVSIPWYFRRFLRREALFCADWCDWWTGGGITTNRRRFSWIDRVERKLEEGSKRSAQFVTVISSVLRDRALSIGVNPEQLMLLPSGADVDGIPVLDPRQCRDTIGLRLDDPVLCFVGYSLWDIELISGAFSQVLKIFPACQLLVVGGGVESPALDMLRERFRVGHEVYLPGDVPYSLLPKFLGATSVHLLPLLDTLANRARVPNKLGDYLASGRPIVANDVGDAGRIVRESGVGCVSDSSPEAFGEAIIEMLSLSSDERLGIGQRARSLAETELSWRLIAGELENRYKGLLSVA
ncbi:MAG: glycosyltransferase family 4 protein [bacterium]